MAMRRPELGLSGMSARPSEELRFRVFAWALRSPERAMVVITHYQRLLNYIVPDFVHVMSKGRVVKSGGKELALELEESGYAQFEDAA